MPWKVTHVMDERLRFIGEYLDGTWSMAALCRAYGISRKTGYKLVRCYEAEGIVGLRERSRAPHHHPHAVSAEMQAELVAVRKAHRKWGPRKVRAWLRRRDPTRRLPAASTVGALFRREGLVRARRRGRRPRAVPSEQPFAPCDVPNAVWSADYKGWFRTADGCRCEPLTISDTCSRCLLCCQALGGTTYVEAQPVFVEVFQEYGLPQALRTDNGPPFASHGIGGLTRLSVWWIRLGIVPQRIQPGRPAQNGRHERMHRTLAEEACRPPQANRRTQQRAFERFRREYNEERPHEALGDRTPSELYQPASRVYPATLPELAYPAHYEVRQVKHNGRIKWHGAWYYLNEALHRQPIGLERVAEDQWELHFGPVSLGVLDGYREKVLRHRVLVLQ